MESPFRALRRLNAWLVTSYCGGASSYARSPSHRQLVDDACRFSRTLDRTRRPAHALALLVSTYCIAVLSLGYGPSVLGIALPSLLSSACLFAMPLVKRDGDSVEVVAPGFHARVLVEEIDLAVVRTRAGTWYWFRLPSRPKEPPFFVRGRA